MNREEILDTIRMLAGSQGFYGRLLSALQGDPDVSERFFEEAEGQNLHNAVDLVIWLET